MTKIKFLNAKQTKKKDTGEPFYIINFLVGDQVVTNYPNGEAFKRIMDKKPAFLGDYKAEFENVVYAGKLSPCITDIQ